MTISDLITHLQTLPQDLTVQCLAEFNRGYDSWTEWEDLTIDDLNVCGKYLEIGRHN